MTERAGHQCFRCRFGGVILPAWAAELVHLPVEVIVAGPAPRGGGRQEGDHAHPHHDYPWGRSSRLRPHGESYRAEASRA